MKRITATICFAAQTISLCSATVALADSIGVQQTNARNFVYVIQERSPFHTHNSSVTATTGGTTVTEITAIGPDPVPLSVTQAGVINRASIYQRGASPNLDVSQSGFLNVVRSQQHGMP